MLSNLTGPMMLRSSSKGDENSSSMFHSNSFRDEGRTIRSNSNQDEGPMIRSSSNRDEGPMRRSNSKRAEGPVPRSNSKRAEGPVPRSNSKRAEGPILRFNIKKWLRDLFRVWKVASYILGLVFSESLASTVAVSNLMSYLMDVLEEKLPRAASTVNLREGVSVIMTICVTFLADACIGRYQTVVYSTIVYISGLSLLTLSASHLVSKTKIVFHVALLFVSLGEASYSPVLKAFAADQLSRTDDLEDGDKIRVKFWWLTGRFPGAIAGFFLLAVVENTQAWLKGYAVLALTMLVSFGVFIYGKRDYRYRDPSGTILTRAPRVCVAAMLKRHLICPSDPGELHEGAGTGDLHEEAGSKLHHTDKLSFLDKAAIKEPQDLEKQTKNWRLCTVTEVEETKLLFFMFPMWTTFLIYGLLTSLESTFFLAQGSNMDTHLGHINVPLIFLFIFSTISSEIIRWCCQKWSKKLSRFTLVLTPTWEIGIGMVFSVICCTVASLVETRRLGVAKQNYFTYYPDEDPVLMSVFWLVPQFLLLGVMDGFIYFGMENFFCSQVPESMKNFGPLFSNSVIGIGNLLILIVIMVLDKANRWRGRPSWFADTIDSSRLDYFYWTLTILSFIGLLFHQLVARTCIYKKASTEDESYAADVAADTNL